MSVAYLQHARFLPRVWPRVARRNVATKTPPFPVIPSCPPATCSCLATPEMPEGLPIDRKANLNGNISQYSQQVLVCTGKNDWSSRIEEDNSGDNLAADLKELLGRGGKFQDPFHNVSVLNSSFPSTPASLSSTPDGAKLQTTSVFLLPSFTYVPYLPRVSFDSVEALVRGYLQPEKLHPFHDGLSPIHRDRLVRSNAYKNLLWGVGETMDVMVLICGHGGRDQRCGIMGPALREEFERELPRRGLEVLKGPVEVASEGREQVGGPVSVEEAAASTARVGLISHIGGHKFAGNVIVYLPRAMKTPGGEAHPLAGSGIWYGRVEPKHVEGIVEETIRKGNVISEMFRGGITSAGEIIRL